MLLPLLQNNLLSGGGGGFSATTLPAEDPPRPISTIRRRVEEVFLPAALAALSAFGCVAEHPIQPKTAPRPRLADADAAPLPALATPLLGYLAGEHPWRALRPSARQQLDDGLLPLLGRLALPDSGDQLAKFASRRRPLLDDWVPLGTIQQQVATYLDDAALPRRALVRVRTDDGSVLAALRLGGPLWDDLPARGPSPRRAQPDDGSSLRALSVPLLGYLSADDSGRPAPRAARPSLADGAPLQALGAPALFEYLQGDDPKPRPWATPRSFEPQAAPPLATVSLSSFLSAEQTAAIRQLPRWRADDGAPLPPLLRPYVDTESTPQRRWATAARLQDGASLPALSTPALREYLDAEPQRSPRIPARRIEEPGSLPALVSISLRSYLDADAAQPRGWRTPRLLDSDALLAAPILRGYLETEWQPRSPRATARAVSDDFSAPQLVTLRSYLDSEPSTRSRSQRRFLPVEQFALPATIPPAIQLYLDVDVPRRAQLVPARLLPEQGVTSGQFVVRVSVMALLDAPYLSPVYDVTAATRQGVVIDITSAGRSTDPIKI